jgi:hypothetical protein
MYNKFENCVSCELDCNILLTPGECHTQLHMNTEIFMDLHDLLVSRYGLQASMHMNTYEVLAIFLFVCSGNESNREPKIILITLVKILVENLVWKNK